MLGLGHLARMFRRAGPAAVVPVPARLAILPASTMPSVDRRLARIRRLREVIPQFAAKIARAERKRSGDAAALMAKRDALVRELEQHLTALKADMAGVV